MKNSAQKPTVSPRKTPVKKKKQMQEEEPAHVNQVFPGTPSPVRNPPPFTPIKKRPFMKDYMPSPKWKAPPEYIDEKGYFTMTRAQAMSQ